jgi:alpha-mannosidase
MRNMGTNKKLYHDTKEITMKVKVHLVGNAHLDPVWLWRWQDGLAEIKATFRSALDRMEEFPEFIFTSACAAYYEWIEENSPEMFEEIKQRVKEGRWVITGGWWIQPDCNIPSGESFARHSLYSQRYFESKFGIIAKVGYNVDSFGHSGMLPQILKKSGMDYYVFMRPGDHEKELPGNLFWWESMDGSRVMTYKIPYGYNTGWRHKDGVEIKLNKFQDLYRELKELDEPGEKAEHGANNQCPELMLFYGVGNHGGGPTISNLNNIRDLQKKLGKDKFVHSSPNQYFEEVSKLKIELPIVKDDLQHHASGCYSAHSQTKKNNRIAEHRLITAEKFMTVSHILTGLPYDGTKIKNAWKNVLFNQFHDIMGGCSIKEAYEDALEFYGESLKIGSVILNSSLQKMSWAIDTSKGIDRVSLNKEMDGKSWESDDRGVPVVIFNPLSWDVQIPVQVNRNVKGVTDEFGNALEIQTVRASQTNGVHDLWDTLFIGNIPSMGYRVYWIYKNESFIIEENEAQPTNEDFSDSPIDCLETAELVAENKWVKLEIDKHTGFIKQLFDKQNNVSVFDGYGAVPIVIDEYEADTWAHGIFSFRNEIGRFSDAEVKKIENGPLRTVIRAVSKYNNSVLQQDYIIYKYKKDIEVKAKLNWQEKHKMLKISFPVNITDPVATYEIPYGYIERPVNGEEEPGQQWVDIFGTLDEHNIKDSPGNIEKSYGLALLNDSKYSFDVKNNDLRMTIVRSPIFADHYGKRDEFREFMDQGINEFKYVLVPHKNNWQQSGIVQKAFELNTEFPKIIETYHKGHLSQTYSGIKISKGNIIAVTLKKGEDNDSYILRCYEIAGIGTEEVNIDIPLLNRQWKTAFSACEIKTFSIPFDINKPVIETNLLEY